MLLEWVENPTSSFEDVFSSSSSLTAGVLEAFFNDLRDESFLSRSDNSLLPCRSVKSCNV